MKLLSTTLFIALAFTTACKKKDDASKAGGGTTAAGDKKTAEPAAPAAKLTFKKLGDLGLEAEVPADAEITDDTKGAGFPSATIYASPTTFVTGKGDMSDLKDTIEDTKKQLEKDPNKLKGWTKEEKTADGWLIEGDRDSMTGDKLFAFSMRRTIDGKPWDCGTNASSADERAKGEKLCSSLRAAK